MEFRLLGSLEAASGAGSVPLGGPRQRALLAILLLHANEVVSRDTLIEALWPERQLADAAHSLDVHVSRLRRALGPEATLSTRGAGYVLEVEPEQIDARRFERLLGEARAANAAGSPARALKSLDAALSLWRGDALDDLAYEDFARPEIERLEGLRLVAIEQRCDAELALGRHEVLVPHLESLVAKHPLRERLREQLMLALYRSGRQADALAVYRDGRRRLLEEQGLEPGQPLKQLEQAILRQDPALDASVASPARRTKHRTMLAAAMLAVAAGAAAAGVLLANGGMQSSRAQDLAQPNSLALVAAGSGKVFGQAPVHAAVLTRFGEGGLWNVAFDGEVTRLDATTGQVVTTIGTGITHPGGLAVGEGSVWVTDCCSPTIVRIDPASNVVAERIRLPTPQDYLAAQTGEVAVGAGSVWVGQGFANPSYVFRLDPRTGRVQHRIRIPEGGAQGLAFGDGALWVAGPVLGYLSKIDPATNRIAASEQSLHSWLCCVAAGGGYAWAAINPDHTVWKIGQDGRVLAGIKLPAAIENLTYADDAVWAADGEAGEVVRIDPDTNATKRYRLGHHLTGVAVRRGVVAVGVQRSGSDATAGLKGAIVRVALRGDSIDSIDPVVAQGAFNPQQTAFHFATCAKLLNYPDAADDAGRRLVPEVAASWPSVTDGGRTYTLQIRQGYGFSPPSDERVTATSFAHALERNLSPKTPGPWAFAMFGDILGAAAFHTGRAHRISGVTARGDRLVIRLEHAVPDFPSRLASPQLCAVPATLPVVAGGLDGPIPSAGPYYVADRGGNVIVLKRNPNYHGSRLQRLDAIVYEWDIRPGVAAKGVERGQNDYVFVLDPALAPATAVARAARARYRQTPTNWTELLALNARRPLFADVQMRRAVAQLLDRRVLAAGLDVGTAGAVATSHFLSSNLLAAQAGPAYPLSGNLRAARRLAGTGRRHAVLALFSDADGKLYDAAFADALRAQFEALGIRLTVHAIPQTLVDMPARLAAELAQADLAAVQRNASQTVDPVSYLRGLPYLPAFARVALDRSDRLPYRRRAAAAATVAAALEHDATYVGFAYDVVPEIVSKRLGCQIHHPVYAGLDLAVLCVRGP